MAAPTSTDEVLTLVRKSGLVPENRLDAFLREKSDNMPNDAVGVAATMVRNGILTKFQAQQILRGKYKSFNIGRYRVLEPLGVGGMSRVYLCEHTTMAHRVAIKIVSADTSIDPSIVKRFLRESRAVASLSHPNIVRAHDAAEEPGKFHYLVMEYIDGVNLHDLVSRNGRLSASRAAHYISQAARGLQYFHEAGLVHRDIKPGNLLLDRKGVVKILDLGLVRARSADTADPITETFDRKSILGTADYMSPEQAIQTSDVDIRSDIYSLGASLYYLLAGRAPFPGDNFAHKLLAHQMKMPDPLHVMRTDIPAELNAVVEKMMAKSLDVRYQLPSEIVEALEPWTHDPVDPPETDELPRRSKSKAPPQPGSSALRSGSSINISDTPRPTQRLDLSVFRFIAQSRRHVSAIVGRWFRSKR